MESQHFHDRLHGGRGVEEADGAAILGKPAVKAEKRPDRRAVHVGDLRHVDHDLSDTLAPVAFALGLEIPGAGDVEAGRQRIEMQCVATALGLDEFSHGWILS